MTDTEHTDEDDAPDINKETAVEDLSEEYSEVKRIAGELQDEHDRRFGEQCEERDLTAHKGDEELIVHCETCEFLVERLTLPA
jgi:hypothetical protein